MSPKVSVATVTYNHESYIEQAVESVMRQETDFEVEMVVGEDCSTDRTRQILLDLRERYPERLRLLLREKNLGASHNVADVLRSCRGEYVALLDGDDYFTSTRKLAMQADLLDRNPEMAICGHRHEIEYELEPGPGALCESAVQSECWTLDDFVNGYYVHPSSVMARHEILAELPVWFHDVETGDMAMLMLCLQRGTGGFINELMSVYRVHGGGVWSGKQEEEQLRLAIRALGKLAPRLESRHRAVLRRRIAILLVQVSRIREARGDLAEARGCLREAMRLAPRVCWGSVPGVLWTFQLAAPRVYRGLRALKRGLVGPSQKA